LDKVTFSLWKWFFGKNFGILCSFYEWVSEPILCCTDRSLCVRLVNSSKRLGGEGLCCPTATSICRGLCFFWFGLVLLIYRLVVSLLSVSLYVFSCFLSVPLFFGVNLLMLVILWLSILSSLIFNTILWLSICIDYLHYK
jgi:hypothetical protein